MAVNIPPAPYLDGPNDVGAHYAEYIFHPTGDGGSKITNYLMQYSTTSNFTASTTGSVSSENNGNVRVLKFDGLKRLTKYWVRVRAENKIGMGDWSNVLGFTTFPDPPGIPTPTYIDAQGTSGIHYKFNPSSDKGGASSVTFDVGWGTSPNGVEQTMTKLKSGDVFITGLAPYTTYYVWSRAVNTGGPGAWSAPMSIRTHAVGSSEPQPQGVKDVDMVSVFYSWIDGNTGGPSILEKQVGYGTDPNAVQQTIGIPLSQNTVTVTGLTPASNYYIWARQRTEEGWSSWSARTAFRTIAGARVMVGGAWREAIPFVRVNGVWRYAQPYARKIGLWNKAI